MKYWFNSLLAILATAATYFWGGWDLPIIVLVCFMVADYISGVLLAITRRELSSSVGFKGLAKKAVMLVVIALAVQLDRLINDGDGIFRTLCAYFYIANEGISILENAAARLYEQIGHARLTVNKKRARVGHNAALGKGLDKAPFLF